jgi:hypothetical protein
MPNKGNNDY